MPAKVLDLVKGVNVVSIKLAEQIWNAAADGSSMTDMASVEKIMEDNEMEPAAKDFLLKKLDATERKCPGHLAPLVHIDIESQYKIIMKVKYEKELLNIVIDAVQGGKSMNLKQADHLWQEAMDGQTVTETEFRTIEFIMAFYQLDLAAHDFLEGKLAAHTTIKTRKFKGISWAPMRLAKKRSAEEAGLTCWLHIYDLCREGEKCKKKHESGFESGTTQRAKSRVAAKAVAEGLHQMHLLSTTAVSLTTMRRLSR